jgi:hypothetical protein
VFAAADAHGGGSLAKAEIRAHFEANPAEMARILGCLHREFTWDSFFTRCGVTGGDAAFTVDEFTVAVSHVYVGDARTKQEATANVGAADGTGAGAAFSVLGAVERANLQLKLAAAHETSFHVEEAEDEVSLALREEALATYEATYGAQSSECADLLMQLGAHYHGLGTAHAAKRGNVLQAHALQVYRTCGFPEGGANHGAGVGNGAGNGVGNGPGGSESNPVPPPADPLKVLEEEMSAHDTVAKIQHDMVAVEELLDAEDIALVLKTGQGQAKSGDLQGGLKTLHASLAGFTDAKDDHGNACLVAVYHATRGFEKKAVWETIGALNVTKGDSETALAAFANALAAREADLTLQVRREKARANVAARWQNAAGGEKGGGKAGGKTGGTGGKGGGDDNEVEEIAHPSGPCKKKGVAAGDRDLQCIELVVKIAVEYTKLKQVHGATTLMARALNSYGNVLGHTDVATRTAREMFSDLLQEQSKEVKGGGEERGWHTVMDTYRTLIAVVGEPCEHVGHVVAEVLEAHDDDFDLLEALRLVSQNLASDNMIGTDKRTPHYKAQITQFDRMYHRLFDRIQSRVLEVEGGGGASNAATRGGAGAGAGGKTGVESGETKANQAIIEEFLNDGKGDDENKDDNDHEMLGLMGGYVSAAYGAQDPRCTGASTRAKFAKCNALEISGSREDLIEAVDILSGADLLGGVGRTIDPRPLVERTQIQETPKQLSKAQTIMAAKAAKVVETKRRMFPYYAQLEQFNRLVGRITAAVMAEVVEACTEDTSVGGRGRWSAKEDKKEAEETEDSGVGPSHPASIPLGLDVLCFLAVASERVYGTCDVALDFLDGEVYGKGQATEAGGGNGARAGVANEAHWIKGLEVMSGADSVGVKGRKGRDPAAPADAAHASVVARFGRLVDRVQGSALERIVDTANSSDDMVYAANTLRKTLELAARVYGGDHPRCIALGVHVTTAVVCELERSPTFASGTAAVSVEDEKLLLRGLDMLAATNVLGRRHLVEGKATGAGDSLRARSATSEAVAVEFAKAVFAKADVDGTGKLRKADIRAYFEDEGHAVDRTLLLGGGFDDMGKTFFQGMAIGADLDSVAVEDEGQFTEDEFVPAVVKKYFHDEVAWVAAAAAEEVAGRPVDESRWGELLNQFHTIAARIVAATMARMGGADAVEGTMRHGEGTLDQVLARVEAVFGYADERCGQLRDAVAFAQVYALEKGATEDTQDKLVEALAILSNVTGGDGEGEAKGAGEEGVEAGNEARKGDAGLTPTPTIITAGGGEEGKGNAAMPVWAWWDASLRETMFNRITERVIDETTKFVDNAMAQDEGVIVQDLGTLQEVLVRAKEVRGEDHPSCVEIEANVIALEINGLERNGTEVGAIEAARRLAQEHKRGTAHCSAAQMEQFDRVLIRAVDEVGCDEEGNPSQEGAEQLRSLLESAQEMYGEADVRCFEIAAKRLLADADMAELVPGTYLTGGGGGGV